jgi:hypothetical protein
VVVIGQRKQRKKNDLGWPKHLGLASVA